jgi:hypothetical protein
MYFHYQNLKKEAKETRYISHARFWLGRRPQLHCEWVVPGRNISMMLNLNGYGETAIGGHIGLWLFTFYWGIKWPWLYSLIGKVTRRRDQKYTNGRDIGFTIDAEAVSISLWHDPMESRGDDPFWWHKYFFIKDMILGRAKCTTETLEEREVVIPMPENNYPATAKLIMYTWKRPRWFSEQMKRVSIDVPEGIPHEGKGENGWDCGEDRTYGTTTGKCQTIAEGVGMLVGSVLRERVRHGGWKDWTYKRDQKPGV